MDLMTIVAPPPFRTRKALPPDAEALVALVNSAYRGEGSRAGWTTEADLLGGQRTDAAKILEMIEHPQGVVLLGLRDGVIEACVYLQRKEGRAYLGMLTVRPDLQNSGWGRRLLDQSEEWVREVWRLPLIEMTVITKRTELIRWYERRGYQQTEKRLPFPYGDDRFGIPKVPDLEFVILEKTV